MPGSGSAKQPLFCIKAVQKTFITLEPGLRAPLVQNNKSLFGPFSEEKELPLFDFETE